MNVLFLTLVQFNSLQEHNIYTDLLRTFIKNGHRVYAISPVERKENSETHVVEENNATILCLRIGDTQKTNAIKKGINTVLLESAFKKGIKNYFSDVKFDLILYSTPPITLVGAVEYVKNRDGAKTYLLLKDIFPQNAVDIGMLSKRGLKGFLYKHFRSQEKKLYAISDYIGCMSPANVEYVLKHNLEVKERDNEAKYKTGKGIVEVCPNSIEVIDKSVNEETRYTLRFKYKIPEDKIVFVYGGNLGKPQGIPFLVKCLKRCKSIEDAFFVIVGDGTEYSLLEDYVNTEKPGNVKLMKRLPKEDYDNMVGACDVGLIFLDYRFTIPNFPSRLLAYMQAKLPVLAVTDPNTDIRKAIVDGGFGLWCESKNADEVKHCVAEILSLDLNMLGLNGYKVLERDYSSDEGYQIILSSIKGDNS